MVLVVVIDTVLDMVLVFTYECYSYIHIKYTSEAEASRSRLALGLGFCFDDVRVPVSVQREWRSGLAVRPHLPDSTAAAPRATAAEGANG